MDETEVENAGLERGYVIASWVDLPEPFSEIPKDMDWVGHDEINSMDAAHDYFVEAASSAESNSRQYTDFTTMAKELNELDADTDIDFEPWEVFDEHIQKGIAESWAERGPDFYQGDF